MGEETGVVMVSETVQLPKESNDVRVFIVNLIKGIKAKKSAAELVGAELGDLMSAIEGFDKIPAEAKDPHELTLGALLAADVVAALKG